MIFSDPDYRLINEFDDKPLPVNFWVPSEVTGYHKSREMAMSYQSRFSQCGISPEVLKSFAETLLEYANKQNNKETLKTDIGVIANNILYRMSCSVDEVCALRMGAISVFMEGEDPDKYSEAWTKKKLALIDQYPDLYTFFLHMGVAFTPEYNEVLRNLQAEEYLMERQIMLDSLTLK